MDGNIKMDLEEIRYKAVDWIHLAQSRVHCPTLVSTVMKFQVT
jgi:hypothetical protein